MHNAYKVGDYWNKESMSDSLHERRNCRVDGDVDSMEHILFHCKSREGVLIWHCAARLWVKASGTAWPGQSLCYSLGCSHIKLSAASGKNQKGMSRLFRILTVEASYLIWVLRCERVITEKVSQFSADEVKNRWDKIIKDRAMLDYKMSNPRYRKKAIPLKMVMCTWGTTGLLQVSSNNAGPVPVDGVLVGSGLVSRRGEG